MGFLKNLFSGKESTAEEKEQKQKENDFDVLKYDGIHAMRIGRFAYAIACFTHALDIHEDVETREHLAAAYVRTDDLELALDEFSKLIELAPDNIQYSLNKANLLYELEKYEECRDLCNSMSENGEKPAVASYILSRVELAEGKLESAEKNVNSAIEKSEEFESAWLLRADIRYKREDYSGALSDLDHLLNGGQESDEVLLQKGKVLEAMGNQEDAILYYNNVLTQNPFIMEAYANLALLHIRSGNYDKASEVISDGLEQNGESSLLIGIRAALKASQGDSEGAALDRQLSAKYKKAEEEQEDENYDVERSVKEQMMSTNPLL